MNPRIKICPYETRFFHKYYHKGLHWYRNQMPRSYEDDVTIEKTPDYIYLSPHQVPQRIHRMDKNIKLIIILRDPVQRAISAWTQYKENGNIHGHIKNSLFLSQNHVRSSSQLIRRGIYHEQIEWFYKFFRKKQILLLDGDAFIKNPVPLLNKVEDFLGVPRYISRDNVVYNSEKGFFCKKIGTKTKCASKSKGRKCR